MAITYVQHIDAPVETVFDFLDDDRKLKTWMEGLEDTIYLADYDRANPVGARFTQRIREGGRITEYDGEVTAYSRPHRLAVKLWSKHFTVDVDYLLHAEHGGTRLDYSADLKHATTVARVMGTLFGWLTRHILVNQMNELKRVAEEAAAAAPRAYSMAEAAYSTAEAAQSIAESELEPGPVDGSELEPAPTDGSELEPEPVAESELEPAPTDGSELEPEPVAESELESRPEAESELEPAPEDGSELEPGPVDGSELEPEPEAESELEPEPEAHLSWGPESQASADASEDETAR